MKPLRERRVRRLATSITKPEYCYFEKDVIECVEALKKDIRKADEINPTTEWETNTIIDYIEKWLGGLK